MITRKTSLLRSLLLAVTLTIGLGTVWFVVLLWLGTTYLEARADKSQLVRESLIVKADGTPLIQSFSQDYFSRVSYRDLNGNVHEAVDGKDLLSPNYLYGAYQSTPFFWAREWQQRIKFFMNRARTCRDLVLRPRRQVRRLRLFHRLRAGEQPAHRLHRDVWLPPSSRAERRPDPGARRAAARLLFLEFGARLDVFEPQARGGATGTV